MKIIKNIALAMLLIWVLQLGFNSCANLVKDFVLNNITISYEDKSEHILKAHRAAYGAVGLLAAIKHGKNLRKGRGEGILAGEIAYFGKKIARKRGLGLVGLAIHSLGVSMLENQILNKPLFSRYKTFLPPISLEFDIQEGFYCHFLAGSLTGIALNVLAINGIIDLNYWTITPLGLGYLVLFTEVASGNHQYFARGVSSLVDLLKESFSNMKNCYRPLDSILSGAPMFVPKEGFFDGLNIGGVITAEEGLESLSHEMIHSCQYRELAVVNLFIEKRLLKDFPVLFSQDLARILFEEICKIEEEEPLEYDVIYTK